MSDLNPTELMQRLDQLIDAIHRLGPPRPQSVDFASADGFLWDADIASLRPVPSINRVEAHLLHGIERSRQLLLENTRRFAQGLPANNALLWGARGMGKSSLVKAAHGVIIQEGHDALKLVEIHREDIVAVPALLRLLRPAPYRFIVFCDDLSFDHDDTAYKSLKAVLDGGIEGRPNNVIFYATSNRRHLMPREMIDNEKSTAINPSEVIEEKVSLSDRFGLWLGFHKCSQDEYLLMIEGYATHYSLALAPEKLKAEAIEWAATRGSRSGRTAWQYIQDLAGRLGQQLG